MTSCWAEQTTDQYDQQWKRKDHKKEIEKKNVATGNLAEWVSKHSNKIFGILSTFKKSILGSKLSSMKRG